MTIRRTLLVAFLVVGLLPASVLTALAFERTRSAMRDEIAGTLQLQAQQLATDVDQAIAERLRNATTWNHLEVMQDLQVGDIDKRLSGFLQEMKRRYGEVYVDLHALDAADRIVASSSPSAIGRIVHAASDGEAVDLPGGTVRVEPPGGSHDRILALRVPIASMFSDEALGTLLLDVDWGFVEGLLDAAARDGRSAELTQSGAGVLAAAGPLAASGMALDDPQLMSGKAETELGWQAVIVQPMAQALAPVRRMAQVFIGLLAMTALAMVAVAWAVAGSIARPIVRLTDYTRRFVADGAPPPPPPPASGEVGELGRVFVRTVEDLERSRASLVRASKLAAVGEMAAVMAHEIRTPLGILRSSAQMLEIEPQLSAEGRELTGFITAETERLNRLVTAMLDSARQRPLQRAPLVLDTLLAQVCSLVDEQAQRRGIAIEQSLGLGDRCIDGDAEQLTQVFLNLLINALQVCGDGGHIAIRSSADEHAAIVEVADDGPGIPEDLLPRLFEPFVFRRKGGTGLGLAVVSHIVGAHGGHVSAHNGAAGGACFRVRLPLPAATSTSSGAVAT